MRKVNHHKPVCEIEDVNDLVAQEGSLADCVLQGLDLSDVQIDWAGVELHNTIFLGCKFRQLEDEFIVRRQGGMVFPPFEGLPYDPYRASLYTCEELMTGYDAQNDQSRDFRIYQHFSKSRRNPDIKEALAQRIHDHAIDDALSDLLQFDNRGMTDKRCVGFMGGHGVLRTDPYFRKVAQTARLVAQKGYFVVSGGGPGMMEAANLGGYMGHYSEAALDEAIHILSQAPFYTDSGYLQQAKAVRKRYRKGSQNLAIPTWFYGHEPSNLFATHIAKYFSNSIREDRLLAISLYGVVYAPGSAGTTQEIFMDATQNHYGTFGYHGPMIFLSKQRYTKETFIFPLLQQLARGRAYAEMLFVTDEPEEVVAFIEQHPPIPKM